MTGCWGLYKFSDKETLDVCKHGTKVADNLRVYPHGPDTRSFGYMIKLTERKSFKILVELLLMKHFILT